MAKLLSEPMNLERGCVQQRVALRKETGKLGSNVVDGLALRSTNLESMIESLRKAIVGNMQRTLNLFREWDCDGNGSIEREEFAHALSVLSLETDSSVATALFDALDDDHNGALSFSELHSKLRQRIDVAARRKAKRQQNEAKRQQNEASRPTPRSHSQAAHAGASSVLNVCRKALAADLRRTVDLFRAWDVDGSGMIDKREFGFALGNLVPDATPEVCNALFDVLDTDQSGTLEYCELHAKLRMGGRGARRKQMAAQKLTSRTHAMQDDVVGRVHTRTGATDLAPLTTLLPAAERRSSNLPPRPTLPQTSPARHRRVGKRLPIIRQRGVDRQVEADKAALPIMPALWIEQASFLPAQQGFKYHWH